MSDLRNALAFVLRRQGRETMTAEELRNVVSFDLRWFKPGEARTFVRLLQEAGLVEGDDASLRPTFDPQDVDVPVPFRPSPSILDAPAAPALVDAVVEAVATATGRDADLVRHDIRRERDRLGALVTEEVAALLLAESMGVDVTRWLDAAGKRVRAGAEGA